VRPNVLVFPAAVRRLDRPSSYFLTTPHFISSGDRGAFATRLIIVQLVDELYSNLGWDSGLSLGASFISAFVQASPLAVEREIRCPSRSSLVRKIHRHRILVRLLMGYSLQFSLS
jgi:hypothetical protein